ncbi:MAG: YceI family protein [Bacteroidota bacterium]
MRKFVYPLVLSLFLTATATTAYFTSWSIASDYQIKFTGTGATGTFSNLKGTINFMPDNLAGSNMRVSVATATISTGNTTKDKHARGESWFHADKYPKITFVSTAFRQKNNAYTVVGQMTIRGVNQSVEIPFTFEETSGGAVFVGEFTVDRQDYGIEGPWLSFTVADEFDISLRVPVKRQ